MDDSGSSDDETGAVSNDVGGANSAGPLLLFSQLAKNTAKASDANEPIEKNFVKVINPPLMYLIYQMNAEFV